MSRSAPRLPFLRRLAPRSLTGQLVLLLLLALVLAQAIGFLILTDERHLALWSARREQVFLRTASIVRLLESTPHALHGQIIGSASSSGLRFWLAPQSAVAPDRANREQARLAHRFAILLDRVPGRPVLIHRGHERIGLFGGYGEGRFRRWWGGDGDDDHHRRRPWRAWRPHHDRPTASGLTISVRLAGGPWLNAATLQPPVVPALALTSLLSLGVTAIALVVIVILLVRRLTGPMKRLAAAADQLGRGESGAPLPEEGPDDIRQTTRAFNRMRARLERFVQDRTRMLAAISHDLRTPITTLRLRAEFVEDGETRTRILETLEEMQHMAEATLAFAREEAAQEDTRKADLVALVESLCADFSDLGREVSFLPAARRPYACRPTALRRAVRNLIENAVAYGSRARVSLEEDAAGPRILIDDDGPGIPENRREDVFKPFFRLEESRSRETGGVGLGLAIARSIVRGHGGDIELGNRPEGGLRAVIRLPAEEG